jgi:uncharacterized protein involved in cysteine biosynthesis
MTLFAPLLRALAQLNEPAFVAVLLRSLGWTLGCFAGLFIAMTWGVAHWLPSGGWWAWLAGLLGGVGAALLTFFLFLPVAMGIAAMFTETVARAVEARYYPNLPAATGASMGAQVWDSIAVSLRVLWISLLALLLAFVLPGIGVFLGWAISGWAIGRGLFVAVAMRRMSRQQAQALARQQIVPVLAQGGILALAGFLPPLNLLVPVLGVAAMVHLLHRPPSGVGDSMGI